MSQLYQQPFSNTIRTISGVTNVVAQDDYVLLCDTSSGSVILDLPTIPSNYWSSQWRIYVMDASFNASVNSITINAPLGFTINGQSSVVVISNGAGYQIMVSTNTNYSALYSGVISGTTTTPLIPITNAGLLALVNGGTLSAGQFYFVTDVSNMNFASGEGVAVQGIKVNGYSTILGSGSFFNADYQSVGDYTGVANYVNNVGIWSSTPSPSFVQWSVAIYNNLHYQNVTGVWGNAPDTDLVNWQLLGKTKTNGYILVQDAVKYDVLNNVITYRADDKNNEVDRYAVGGFDSLINFQWGRNVVKGNKLKGNSIMKTTNSYCAFNGNILENGILQDATGYDAIVTAGSYTYNTIIEGASVINLASVSAPIGNGRNAGKLTLNHFGNSATIRFTEIGVGVNFIANTMEVVNSNLGNITTTITSKRCVSGFSNFEKELYCGVGANSYYKFTGANGILTIDSSYLNENNWVGIFFLRDAFDFIDTIIDLPTNHICTFYASTGSILPSLVWKVKTLALALADNIVGNANQVVVGNNSIRNYTDGGDYITIQKSGTLNQVVLFNSTM